MNAAATPSNRPSDMQTDNIKSFEAAFQAACEKFDVMAAYVLVKGHDERGAMLMIGGCTEVSDFVERGLLPHTVEAHEGKH